MEFITIQENLIDIIFSFVKTYLISIFTLYLSHRIINKQNCSKIANVVSIVLTIIVAIIYIGLRYKVGLVYGVVVLISLLSTILIKTTKKSIFFSILIIAISLSINNILFFIATAIGVLLNWISNSQNQYIEFAFIVATYLVIIYSVLKIKKFKKV